jgi:hypothetical protein
MEALETGTNQEGIKRELLYENSLIFILVRFPSIHYTIFQVNSSVSCGTKLILVSTLCAGRDLEYLLTK